MLHRFLPFADPKSASVSLPDRMYSVEVGERAYLKRRWALMTTVPSSRSKSS